MTCSNRKRPCGSLLFPWCLGFPSLRAQWLQQQEKRGHEQSRRARQHCCDSTGSPALGSPKAGVGAKNKEES